MKERRKSIFYKLLRFIVCRFYKKRAIWGLENLPTDASMIVGNHAQLHGPLSCEIFFPRPKKIWTIGNMMHLKEVPAYAYKDFWSNKPKYSKLFYKIISYVIAPLSVYLFRRADTIPVYKDNRMIYTVKTTLKKLDEGCNIILFPECEKEYNEIINEFQDRFVDIAKFYYKKYNKILSFVPMYNATELRKIIIGKPIKYNPEIPIEEQRKIIIEYLKSEITKMAKIIKRHKVVPYKNIKKKDYQYSLKI